MKKVLFIDDEEDLRFALRLYLEDNGISFFEAPNGKEGIDIAKQEKPDLIIIDYFMPIMDGMTAIKKLKQMEETKPIPIILYTAFLDVLEEDELKQMEAVEYVKKPQPMTNLFKIISKYLENN